ncbi:hypothetical protein [Cellulophaga sp. L1A9]|uniref:hypothetical protein n=1 Tax=Cellulophaga sp. L1A9 TaxID=2686362 RepID=UPI00131A7865|nr:hypothetical protein [Cellulophaga sp. L1A9]
MISTAVPTQKVYEPVAKEILEGWLAEAQEANEMDASQLKKLEAEHEAVLATAESTNSVFDYGHIHMIVLQPGLASASEKELSGAG